MYEDDFIVYEEEEEEEEENWSPGDNSPDANFRGKLLKNNPKGASKRYDSAPDPESGSYTLLIEPTEIMLEKKNFNTKFRKKLNF